MQMAPSGSYEVYNIPVNIERDTSLESIAFHVISGSGALIQSELQNNYSVRQIDLQYFICFFYLLRASVI